MKINRLSFSLLQIFWIATAIYLGWVTIHISEISVVDLPEAYRMERSEFLKRIQKLAKEKAVFCSWHPEKGKGSHGVLKYGNYRTTLRNLKEELKTGTYHAMLKQLGLTDKDIV